MTLETSRRSFLKHAGAGLLIAVALPTMARGQAIRRMNPDEMRELAATPNVFLRIGTDDTVTVISKHMEMGQGIYTGLATLAAEELDAAWSQVRVEAAPANTQLYANLNMGLQGTGGSSGVFNSYYQMRKAGAAARAMLVAAAAQRWSVPAEEIQVADGVVLHESSGNRSNFGELADLAATMPFPPEPPLKEPGNFCLIGSRLPRIDGMAKSTGEAQFTIDVDRPGMVQSAILHPPAFGATVRSIDATTAQAIPGVLAVHEVPRGVAVIADTRFAAQRGVAALNVDWDRSGAETRTFDQMHRDYSQAAQEPGIEVELRGEGPAALAGCAQTLDVEYRYPFLAHAPMEPMGAVVELSPDMAEVWMGSHLTTLDQQVIASTLGLEIEQVKINGMMAGGSFGRLGTADAEFAGEAASIAQAWGRGPIKHLWSRENDIRGGRYRPLAVHRLRGGIDAEGNVHAWEQINASQSFLRGSLLDPTSRITIDFPSVEGARDLPYTIPNRRVGFHLMENGVPTSFWRSVGHSHNAYSVETFLDRLLELGGQDAVAGRLALLQSETAEVPDAVEGRLALEEDDNARLRRVIERVADIAGWSGAQTRPGRSLGIAVSRSFRSYVAEVAEVSQGDDGLPRVHKVWCAIDCGIAINPDVVEAQMQGGIGYALGAALFGEITLDSEGRPEQGNFDRYRSLRFREMPEIEVSIIESTRDPTGVGEPGVPPLAPAVANAWRAHTGQAVDQLPFARGTSA